MSTESRHTLPLRFVQHLQLLRKKNPQETDTKGQRTKADIKAAAATLLERQGYEAFTLAKVAKLAEVSRPAVYQYYESQHALVLELLADFQVFMANTLRQDHSGSPGQTEARSLLAINVAYVRFFSANARIIFSIQSVRRSEKDASNLQIDMNDFWAQKIALGLIPARLEADPTTRDVAVLQAYALEHMVDGLLTDIYVRKNPKLKRFASQHALLGQVLTDMWQAVVDQPS
jgi:AcrR family transcriptional regulator